jgi:hypothetical protein
MPVADLAVSLLLALVNNAGQISQLITNAKAQNRDLTMAELQAIIDADQVARASLVEAIAGAQAKGA